MTSEIRPLAGILMGLNVTRGSVSSQMGFGGEVTATGQQYRREK